MLTCVAVACTTLRTVAAAVALPAVRRCKAHCQRYVAAWSTMLSALSWHWMDSLTRLKPSLWSLRGRLLVSLSLPWGAQRKSVFCFCLVFCSSGIPFLHPQFSIERISRFSLAFDLSQLGRLSSRQVIGYSDFVKVSSVFVLKYPHLVTPMSELDNQRAWFVSATPAVDLVGLLIVGLHKREFHFPCVIQSINHFFFLRTLFVRFLY